MDIRSAIEVLKESQGGHTYEIYVPSLQEEVSFKPLKVGQLKSLNKFAIDDEDKFYKALSSLIVELSDSKIKLNEINEIDRTLILSGIKKNNTTSPDEIKISCSDCMEEFSHKLDIKNYDDHESLSDLIEEFNIEYAEEDLKIICTLGLPTVSEQAAYKDVIIQRKKKALHSARKKVKTMINMAPEDKTKFVDDAVHAEERFLASNTDFLFIRKIQIGDSFIDLLTEQLDKRSDLFDQLPGKIKGEVTAKISSQYKETLEHFLKYKVTCPHCKAEFVEEVTISSFFTI